MARHYHPGDGAMYRKQEWCIRQKRREQRERYAELRKKEKTMDRKLAREKRERAEAASHAKTQAKALAPKVAAPAAPKRFYISATVLRKFGLTAAQAQDILDAQNWHCPCCHKPYTKMPVADHDHSTGKFRNFTCGLCNSAMGMVKDNSQTARNVAAYLDLHREAAVERPTES